MAIKVLVVDDSGVMRLIVSDILQQSNSIKVIGTASNGKEALASTLKLSPDVVVMDMVMGHYDGLYGVTQIMKKKPTPVLLLSSLGNTDLSQIMMALHAGAFDYINKPVKNSTKIRDIQDRLIRKVILASKADLKKLGYKKVTANTHTHSFSTNLLYDSVVIGSSTGGPTAIETVVSKLPSNMAIPVFIAQHMPENFIPSFVQRLNKISPLEVVLGTDNLKVTPGIVIIAPGGSNMIVRKNKNNEVVISFSNKKYKEFNFPSVDALMESVAEVYGERTIGAVLTGMGKDGTLGIKKIKEKGGYTIAQDEKSSVVFGMPKEAIKSGKIDSVVPIKEVGNFVVSCLS